MKISLSPMRRDDTIDIVKYGDVLTINGESFDFSSLPDGATIIAGAIPCEWISGHVERIGGRHPPDHHSAAWAECARKRAISAAYFRPARR